MYYEQDNYIIEEEYKLYSFYTYYIKVTNFDSFNDGTTITFRIELPAVEDGKSSSTAYIIDGYREGEVDSYGEVWYKYTATNTGDYEIVMNANERVYMYGYSNPEYSYYYMDNGTNFYYNWYLQEGNTYWFKVVADTDYYTNFEIDINYQGK